MVLLELKNILENIKEAKLKFLKDFIKGKGEEQYDLIHEFVSGISKDLHHPSHFANVIDSLSDKELEMLEKKMKEHWYPNSLEEDLKRDFILNSLRDTEHKARLLNGYLVFRKKINERLGRDPYDGIDKKIFHKTFLELYHPRHFIDLDSIYLPKFKEGKISSYKEKRLKSFSKSIDYIDDIDTLKELKNKYEEYINYFEKHREDMKEGVPYIKKFYKEKIEPLIDLRIKEIQRKKTF